MNKASAILAARRKAKAKAFNIETLLFKEQLDFVRDPARFVTAVCSTRAGKTVACASDLLDTALSMPGVICLYITLARSSAERIVWPELKRLNREYDLKGKLNSHKLSIALPNNSMIYLMGANTDEEIEKVRGLSNVAVVYLDECQAFRAHIRTLVEDIVVKRLYDTNGRCRLIGTPGPILSGYFYEVSQSPAWAHHHWTLHSNIYLQQKSGKSAEELIAQDCAMRGVDITHPSIQRECFGRWAYDPQALLLQYDAALNHYEELPGGEYKYILGVDLGVKDCDSLSVLAYCEGSPITWLVEEIITPNQKIDDLAKQIKSLRDKYKVVAMPTDTGGLGLKVAEDLRSRYGLPLEAADKKEKMSNYKILNNALRTGLFRAKRDSRFAQDCNLLERDDNRSTPDRIVVKGHSDAVDSCLYAFKLSPAYSYVPPPPKVPYGTEEWARMQEELHIKAAIEKVERQKKALEGRGSEYGGWNKDKKGIPDWNKW